MTVLTVFGLVFLWVLTALSIVAIGSSICRAYFNEKRKFLKELGGEFPIQVVSADVKRVH